MMDEQEIKQFRAELKALLEKYRVSISFSVSECSDTYGLSGEKMVISHRPDPKSFREVDIVEIRGWVIDAFEL